MTTINAQTLRAYTQAILQGHGVAEDCARITADCLVDAELIGVATHGVSRLAIYLDRIKAGVVARDNQVRIVRESPSALVVDAGNTLGMPAAKFTMDACIQRASQTGCCFAAVRNSNHFGTAGYFARMAAQQGMVGVCATNLTGKIAPHGAAEPYMGTNPIAVAVPGTQGPVALDMAPSVVALGKLILAQKLGQSIPLGWALDREGNPTTDPAEGRRGSLLPIGGPKGSGMAILVDILCGVLSGGAFGPHLHDLYGDMEHPQQVCHFIGAIDVSHFLPLDDFCRGVEQMRGEIKQLRPAQGVEEILLPGERGQRSRTKKLEQGISLPDEVWRELVRYGDACGVPAPL